MADDATRKRAAETRPVVTIEDLGQRRRIHVRGKHSRLGVFVTESEMETAYSYDLVQAIYAAKQEWVLNEIERSEAEVVREEMLAGVRRYNLDIAGKRVLDFGCGAGASAAVLLRDAAAPPARFIGVDVDGPLVEIARLRLAELGFGGYTDFRTIEMNDPLTFLPDGSLDLVMACEVFEHVAPRDRAEIMRILWSKLAAGGMLYLTSPTRLSPLDRHTTGLWFTYWLPTGLACRWARLLSERCRGQSDAGLIAAGIRGFSYFEARRYLAACSYTDMSRALPLSSPPVELARAKQLWTRLWWPLHRAGLRYVAPYEAFAPHCVLCFRKD